MQQMRRWSFDHDHLCSRCASRPILHRQPPAHFQPISSPFSAHSNPIPSPFPAHSKPIPSPLPSTHASVANPHFNRTAASLYQPIIIPSPCRFTTCTDKARHHMYDINSSTRKSGLLCLCLCHHIDINMIFREIILYVSSQPVLPRLVNMHPQL